MPTQTDRKNFLGGSEAAAVLGLSRWSTPLEVWALKTGQIVKPETKTLAQILGTRLEDTVAKLFTEETGLKVRRVNETIFHEDYPFLGGNIDRAILGAKEGLECKTASGWKAKEWAGEEIPQEYVIQCHHYLAVTGWRKWWLAVLIGNQDFIVKEIKRDEALIKALVEKERLFWEEFVERKIMPTTITANDSDTLYRLFPNAQPSTVILGDEVTRLIESRNAMVQDAKRLEQQIDQHENEIKAKLGENECGTAGKWLIRWQAQAQMRLDIERVRAEAPDLYQRFAKETKFRKLTIRELKGGQR